MGRKEDHQFLAMQNTSGKVITGSSGKRTLTSLDREGRTASTGKVGLVEFQSSSCPASLEFTHNAPSQYSTPHSLIIITLTLTCETIKVAKSICIVIQPPARVDFGCNFGNLDPKAVGDKAFY